MTPIRCLRFRDDDGTWHFGLTDGGWDAVVDLTEALGVRTLPEWVAAAETDRSTTPLAHAESLLRASPRRSVDPERIGLPLDPAELWAAGVTYERSREARSREAELKDDIYDRVYDAPRPELFFKAPAGRVAGPGEPVGLRRDATWHVPEPELTVVLDPAGRIFGYTLGNDMTARDIEAKNPLYLPQAKVFHHAAAIGPTIVLAETVDILSLTIRLTITRRGTPVFSGETPVARLHRPVSELVAYLGREWPLAPWTALMTGTGIVPPDYLALEDGDVIAIEAEPIGTLINVARRIDPGWVTVRPPEPRVLRVDPRDNVVVVLGTLPVGQSVTVDGGISVVVRDVIPFGHKMAIAPIQRGTPVVKYGAVIGTASQNIAPGQHVHVHNMDSNRGRGDLLKAQGTGGTSHA